MSDMFISWCGRFTITSKVKKNRETCIVVLEIFKSVSKYLLPSKIRSMKFVQYNNCLYTEDCVNNKRGGQKNQA